VAPGELRGVVQAYGESLAAKPPEALAAIRQTVTLGGGMSFDDGLAYEREHIIRLAGTDNFREGLAAFTEKRPPKWQG
jgi:enoyl-CoA hydratase/carnithine racemase